MPEILYLDRQKIAFWGCLLTVILLILALWGIPKYWAWVRIHDARTTVEIEKILKESR